VLSGASDVDASGNPHQPTVGSIIEQPQNGTLSMTNSTGAFTYVPKSGFVGRDWFTWQVAGSSGQGPYATVFIDVAPTTVSLSVDNLKPGDLTAQIPNTQFPPDANGDPQYATINLNYPGGLPNGSTVTLSINADVQNDVDVYDGIPGVSGTHLLFGKDAGTNTYTWTVSDTQTPPSVVYAVGLAGTEYDQAVFTLAVGVGTLLVGTPPANSPAPATQPTTKQATTQSTVAGKRDYLIALDGTLDNSGSGTDVFRMTQDFAAGYRGYVPGVANPDTDGRGLNFAFGLTDMLHFVRKAETKLEAFYTEADHRAVALDAIGYSRGAIEAVQLMNDLANNGLTLGPDLTRDGRAIAAPAENLKPPIRFAGLISPVIGPADGTWPTEVPSTVGSIWVASAAFQVAWVRVHEQTITQNPQHPNGVVPIPFDLTHMQIGHDDTVFNRLEEAARRAKVIFGK
jgi:hypothetical protein